MQSRVESDSLGEVHVPVEVYYGAQTARAVSNFSDLSSGTTLGELPGFVRAIAEIKKASALANRDDGRLQDELCVAIVHAVDDLLDSQSIIGPHNFPVDMLHGGGGTSANMNLNEVLAARANELIKAGSVGHGNTLVHPNTHVNMSQSTNDVIPAAMCMCVRAALRDLLEALLSAADTLRAKQQQFSTVVRLGRTCLQDALPMTFGQTFGGYASQCERLATAVSDVRDALLELPLPATAIGTGLGSGGSKYRELLYGHLRAVSGESGYQCASDLFDALSSGDIWIRVSGVLKQVAGFALKLSKDLRLLSSGPTAGLNEITLPAVQPGSSIMPGKINPVIPEMMVQIAMKVFGNDCTVSMAAAGGLLSRGFTILCDKCIAGITVNEEQCRAHAESTLALATAIARVFDYPTASRVAHRAAAEKLLVREVAVQDGLLTESQADRLLDPSNMVDSDTFEKVVSEMIDLTQR